MIFESHAHYDDDAFDEDREQLLSSLQENGIEYVINVGASLKSTASTIELTNCYPFIYGAAGVHPSETAELNEENFKWLAEQCKHILLVSLHTGLVEGVHSKHIAADAATNLKEIDELANVVCIELGD